MMASIARVLVVDDHALVGGGLMVLLGREGVDAVALNGCEAAGLTHPSRRVDSLVVLDLDLEHGLDGVDLIAPLIRAGATVLVCTGETDKVRLGRCLELGSVGVFSKSRPTAELVQTVLAVLDGRPAMRPGERDDMLGALRASRTQQDDRLRLFANLTPREADVLSGLVAGFAPAVIADGAGVSVKTVRNQIDNVLQKLCVRSQLQAVIAAREAGWQPVFPAYPG